MRFIKNFSQLEQKDRLIAGGKGASLAELSRAQFPVPPGFVVLAKAFDAFMAQSGIESTVSAELEKVDPADLASVTRASERIQGLFAKAKIPGEIQKELLESVLKLGSEFIAVRSSATVEDSAVASWAGELETVLNATPETVLEDIRRCWASLFTPRAIVYRFKNGFAHVQVSVAVVVQKMVQSDVAGVAFSVHPVTENRDQMIIEAGWGLGEAVVSGEITPDSYVVDKRDESITETNVSNQDRGLYRQRNGGAAWLEIPVERRGEKKLSDGQISQLAELVIRIEQHYGFPCDIEWALEGDTFYILQSRPITTISSIAH
jgi:pyruvate,water dikinase